MTDQELIEVRARSTWKSVALIAACLDPDPRCDHDGRGVAQSFHLLLAVAIIGSRQLGLSILMHDGAHGFLANGAKLNMALSQWLCAYPVFAETQAYRRYHLQHHAHTQQDDDPDLILSAPFPITRQSYRRKFWRDISGQTGLAQRKAQFINALGDKSWPIARIFARGFPQFPDFPQHVARTVIRHVSGLLKWLLAVQFLQAAQIRTPWHFGLH